jgi:hypothetical protein
MIRIKIRRRWLNYLKENWGSPFIVAFMILLTFSAGMLASGSEVAANEVAIYAYYLLVIGVALQLAAFIKSERGKRFRSEAPHT